MFTQQNCFYGCVNKTIMKYHRERYFSKFVSLSFAYIIYRGKRSAISTLRKRFMAVVTYRAG